MKALFAAAVTSVSLFAGFGVNVDSQSITPAVESLVARNEVQVPLEEHDHDLRCTRDELIKIPLRDYCYIVKSAKYDG